MLLSFTGFDRLLGSHYDQYVIQYSSFKASADASSFDVNASSCISFPGPGDALAMTENPVFEYIGSPGYSAKHQSHNMDKDFDHFKETHNRKYETEEEEKTRKFNFHHNHRFVKHT